MTKQSQIQKDIDDEKDRISRIEALNASMPEHQAKRLEDVKRHAELALARCFGRRLHPSIAARLVDDLSLNPAVLCSIGGGVNELPTSAEGWEAFMTEAVKAESLAQASIDHSDAALKEQLRDEERAKLKGAERMAMARANTLDAYLNDAVKARLQDRLA